MGIIHGYDNAKFTVYPTSGRAPFSVSIPLTNLNGGQVESYEIRKVQHELIDLDSTNNSITKAQSVSGMFIRWTFSYVDFITGNDLLGFNKLFQAAIAGDRIQLMPRIDEGWRVFDVILDSNSFDVALRKGGINAVYHKGFQITFVTNELQTDLKWSIAEPNPAIVLWGWVKA